MPRREPGVYEPSQDDRVFDGAEDDIDEEGSRLPMLIVIALLVLAAFGAVVWLAYTQGVQRGREGAPQVIAAEKGPVRTAPDNPGGKTPYQGLKIYQQPAPPQDESAPAESMPAKAAENTAPAKPAPAEKKAEAPALRQATETPKPKAAPPAKKTAAAHPAKEASAPPAQLSKLSAAKTAKSETPSFVAGGAYTVQIGSYKSEAEANSAWAAYKRKHPAAASASPDIQRADLGSKGVWYRLRVGSFGSRGAAGTFCDELKANGGGGCYPAKR